VVEIELSATIGNGSAHLCGILRIIRRRLRFKRNEEEHTKNDHGTTMHPSSKLGKENNSSDEFDHCDRAKKTMKASELLKKKKQGKRA